MAESRQDELYDALQLKGYPEDFCREIAYRQMNTDYTATRMLGYLYRISEPRPEDVVDEMLAILSDRNAIIQKKELEHAQTTINNHTRQSIIHLHFYSLFFTSEHSETLLCIVCHIQLFKIFFSLSAFI